MKKISKRSGNYSRIEKEAVQGVPYPAPDFITGSGKVGPISGPPAIYNPPPTSLALRPPTSLALRPPTSLVPIGPTSMIPAGGAGGVGGGAGVAGGTVSISAAGIALIVILTAAAGTWAYRSWYQNVDLFERMGISENDSLDDAFRKWKKALLDSDMRSISYFGVSFPKDHQKGAEFVESFNEPFNDGEKINSGHFILGMQNAGVIKKSTSPKSDTLFPHEFEKAADLYNYSNDIQKFVNTYNILAALHREAFSMKAKMSKSNVTKIKLDIFKINKAFLLAIKSAIYLEPDISRKEKIKQEAMKWTEGKKNNLKDYVSGALSNYEEQTKKSIGFSDFDRANQIAYEEAINEASKDLREDIENEIQTGYKEPDATSPSAVPSGSVPTASGEGSSRTISTRSDSGSDSRGMTYAPDPIYSYGYDQDVENIQDFLINVANIRSGEDRSGRIRDLISDGKYGPITNSALKKAVSRIDSGKPTSGSEWDGFISNKADVLSYLQNNQDKFAADASTAMSEGAAPTPIPPSSNVTTPIEDRSAPTRVTQFDSEEEELDQEKVDGIKTVLNHVVNDRLKFEMFVLADLLTLGLSLNEERRIKMFVQAFDGNTSLAAEYLAKNYTSIDDNVSLFDDKSPEEIRSMKDEKAGILTIFRSINEIYKAACGNRYRRYSVGIPLIKAHVGRVSQELASALRSQGSKKNFSQIVKESVQARKNKAKIRLQLR